MKKMSKEEIMGRIRKSLEYPKGTLELFQQLKPGRWKNVPDYFIDDAAREIGNVLKLLKKL
jgi:hypothetical protein